MHLEKVALKIGLVRHLEVFQAIEQPLSVAECLL
jgi:hypothetical protein